MNLSNFHPSTFSAFQSRNYRLYFYGQSVSLIGTWMQRTAVSWVVYTMTHSTFMIGLVLFAGQFPSFLFSLFGGVVSDRYDRFRVLLFTQIASLVQALLLATLVLTGHYAVWEILVLSVFLGIINAFDVPARQSLIYEMVNDKEDLPNALALNSTMVNLARLIGPAIAGIVLEKFGEGVCFLLNAASFMAVIGSLLLMKLSPYTRGARDKRPLTDLREGFRYLRDTPSIAKVIGMLAGMSLLVIPFVTLLPVYARVIFRGNASTFGYINSFIGLGAISGALFLASGAAGMARKKILLINTIVFGAGLILFAYTSWFPLAMLFVMMAGFGMMAQTTITNTIVQTNGRSRHAGQNDQLFRDGIFWYTAPRKPSHRGYFRVRRRPDHHSLRGDRRHPHRCPVLEFPDKKRTGPGGCVPYRSHTAAPARIHTQ